MPLPLTAEPYFWAKNVILPAAVTIATGLLSYYAKWLLRVANSGVRTARIKRLRSQLEFARQLHGKPENARLWISYQTAIAPIFVAGIAFGGSMLAGGMGLGDSVSDLPGVVCGGLMIGLGMGQLLRQRQEAVFALRAAVMFEALEQKLQRRLERLER